MHYRRKGTSHYTEVAPRVIYIIHAPVEDRCVYIGHCRKDLLMDVYRSHLREERYKTRIFIDECKEADIRPCCHILEEVVNTKVMAYRHVIAWNRILEDNGYMILDPGRVNEYMYDMQPYTRSIYDAHKGDDLSQSLSCENCIVRLRAGKLCNQYSTNP